MTDTRPPTMETHRENSKSGNGQLILVPHKDTIRLLEVYVKRSLSVNDGVLPDKDARRREKWVTKRHRHHSSDPSIYQSEDLDSDDSEPGPFLPSVEPFPEEPERPKKEKEKKEKKRSKKNKKSSIWKSFVGFLSRKSSKDKDEEQDSGTETSSDEGTPEASVTCLPSAPLSQLKKKKSTRRKSMRRRFSTKRLSLIKTTKSKELSPADVGKLEAVVSVEPTLSYYEKVSEELEKIVHEVKDKEEEKPLTDEEVINRIIELTKEQGDAIEDKMKDNPTLSNFFQGISYSSFQKLADAYLEKEGTPISDPPTVPPTAPELVKLAFTLDFTARVAGLSRQNIGHITGLGFRYLQETFKYQQACTDHPWSDNED